MNRFVPLLEMKGATSFKQRALQPRPSGVPEGTVAPAETGDSKPAKGVSTQLLSYVALVKFRAPQQVDDGTLRGVGKTLGQLQQLGLTSIIVVDCDMPSQHSTEGRQCAMAQANRIAAAIDDYRNPGARVIDSPITIGGGNVPHATGSHSVPPNLLVGNAHDLMAALQEELIPIIPSYGYTSDTCTMKAVDANDVVLALTRQLSGLQFSEPLDEAQNISFSRSAEVYRLIILDPLGGVPAKNRATGRHLFLNLEQEFPEVEAHLKGPGGTTAGDQGSEVPDSARHLQNAKLAKGVLSLLPPTSSVVITTPQDAARETSPGELDWALVGTRRGQNPLIHSLLTDKSLQSSSLPTERFTPVTSASGSPRIGSLTTLAKRGVPLTIFPNPQTSPWKPPAAGGEYLNLTDPRIDLPRLVHLIEDSFGRKLDVDHYLKRIHGNLAGIIIAGEYEGGALLTWERPTGADGQPVSGSERLVPYLDKFAVLRKSQGVGGVADIVFNAMVRDCFPDGLCWRSRKNNPVNKWYFERSRGTLKFRDMNWSMFWTTPELEQDQQRFIDYQSVCRGIEPSWADKKQVAD